MIKSPTLTFAARAELLAYALHKNSLPDVARALDRLSVAETMEQLERLNTIDRAVAFRTLPKGRALQVFERLDALLQADLVTGLQDAQVAEVFAGLSPDDRVALLDELPASVAKRLLLGLSEKDRALTNTVLGYPQGAVGRYMSPQFVTARPCFTAARTLARVRPNWTMLKAFTRFRLLMRAGGWWVWCPCGMCCVPRKQTLWRV